MDRYGCEEAMGGRRRKGGEEQCGEGKGGETREKGDGKEVVKKRIEKKRG